MSTPSATLRFLLLNANEAARNKKAPSAAGRFGKLKYGDKAVALTFAFGVFLSSNNQRLCCIVPNEQ